MALTLKDRCKQKIAANAGTGNVTLSTSIRGFKTISSALSNGDTSYFCLESANGDWEVFSGTYTASGTTISRDTVLASSNSGNKIDIGTSITFCYIVYPADKAVYKDVSNRAVMGSGGIIFSDASVQTTAATSPDLSPYLTISSAASTYLTQSSATTLLAAKADLVGGLIPSAQLPSYVDDVVEAANLAAFPGTGETGKIYVAIDTGYTYRWSGSVYVRINEVDLSSYLTTATAASTYLPLAGGTLLGDLKFTDATYDIGKSGATRPRDGWFSRKLNVGSGVSLVDNTASGWGYALLFDGTNSGVENGQGAGLGLILRGNTVCLASSSLQSLCASNNLTIGQTDGPHLVAGGAGIASTNIAYNRVITRSSDGLHIFNNTLTSAACLGVYETWTSSTSFGRLQIKANAGAAYQIGSAIGSAGGTNRAIDFGHWNAAGTFASALSIATSGVSTFSGNITATAGTVTTHTIVNQGAIYLNSYNAFITLSGSGASSNLDLCTQSSVRVVNYAGTAYASLICGSIATTQPVSTSGSPTAFTITGAAHTTLAASTEATDINFNLARTVQFATGALTTQRAMMIQAPTYSFVGASTITTASTLSISGAPVAGTNATITNARALNIESGATYLGGTLTVASTSSIQGRMSFTSSASQPLYFGSKAYTASDPAIQFDWGGGGGVGIYGGSGVVGFHSGGFTILEAQNQKLTIRGSVVVSPNWYTAADAGITNGSVANTLKISNGSTGIGHCEMANLTMFNSTTPTTLKLHGTWTSTTSYELINIKGKASANFEIGPENGSAGGTLRGLTIGGYPAGTATIVGWAQFRPNASTGVLEAFYLGPIANSTATGGNARGTNSVDLQVIRAAATQVSSGAGSAIIGGRNCTSSGTYSIAGGDECSATANWGVSLGRLSIASGTQAVALGNGATASANEASVAIGRGPTASGISAVSIGRETLASGYAATAFGMRSKADRHGMLAHSGGYFAASGDAQLVIFELLVRTTSSTPQTMLLGDGTSRLTIPSGKTMSAKVTVKGIKSDGSAKARFVRLVEITNVGGATTLDTAVEAIGTDYNPSGCVCDITADNTNDALDISVTGITAETWRWVAVVDGLEIAYGT